MDLTEPGQRPREKHDRIGNAEVAPGMATGTAEGDLKTAASQRLVHERVSTRAIDHQQGVDEIAPWRSGKQMTHAAQVAFAFFAHVADENNVGGRLELRALQRRGHRQQSDHAGGIVADSGTVQTVGFFARLERGTLREDGIKVRADADHGRGALGVQRAQHVAKFIDLNIFKAERGESVA